MVNPLRNILSNIKLNYLLMKTRNFPVPNSTPIFVEDRDVLGQTKSKGINVFKKYKNRTKNVPDLKVTYAGLGRRTIAKFIDMTIVFIPLLILEMFFLKFDYTNSDFNTYRMLIIIFAWILYNVILEASASQATIGKMIFKLKVIDINGERMGVLRSFLRSITTIISILPLGFGIWCIATDSKKRAWHDLIAGTYVIKS